jgi:hypothetical protein
MMLIGHSMPSVQSIGYTASQPDGGFLGLTGDGLYDGVPTRKARLQWMSTAGTTADSLSMRLFLASAAAMKVACVLGLTLPAGTQLQMAVYNGHGLTTLVQAVSTRTVVFADGTVGAWFIFPTTLITTDAVVLSVYNDVNGVASIAADAVFEVGEIACMPAVDIELGSDWSEDLVDPTEVILTRDSQPASIPRRPYRRLETQLVVDGRLRVREGGLAGDMDWIRLRSAIAQDRRVIAIPRWRDDAGDVDQGEVNATALYGTGRFGKISHVGGDYYSAPVIFIESPAS